jgi:hypothetical protein
MQKKVAPLELAAAPGYAAGWQQHAPAKAQAQGGRPPPSSAALGLALGLTPGQMASSELAEAELERGPTDWRHGVDLHDLLSELEEFPSLLVV